MISNHITDLITAAKELPNSESRNRMVSHLNDALAHARVIEMHNSTQTVGGFISKEEYAKKLGSCSCPDGARLKTCPVHGPSL